MARRDRSLGKKNGQGLVEFALILPVLLLLLFGIIDFGWMIFNYSQLYNAMREATRYGSVVGFVPGQSQMTNCPEIRNQIVRNAGFSGVKATTSYINIWYDDGRAVPSNELGADQSSVVGDCNGDAFNAHSATYVCLSAAACPDRGTPANVMNGDRITIDVNVTVQFLTPFIRMFAPQGVTMHLRNTRSIFPEGLAS